MTVYLYSGCPGSGKSLHLADVLLRTLDAGRPVIANFGVNRDMLSSGSLFFQLDNCDMSPSKLEGFASWYWSQPGAPVFCEDWITLVIDEAQIILNCRGWDAANRSAWIRFFTLHRKLGYKILISSQFLEMIDKQIRDSCIEFEVKHFKMNNYGFAGAFLDRLVFHGRPWIRYGVYWYKKDKHAIETANLFGCQRLYDFYDTRKVFDSADAGSDLDTVWFLPQLPQAS